MLRNTFRSTVAKIYQSQAIRKYVDSAAKDRVIRGKPLITETKKFNSIPSVKGFATNVPNLQKEP